MANITTLRGIGNLLLPNQPTAAIADRIIISKAATTPINNLVVVSIVQDLTVTNSNSGHLTNRYGTK